MSEQLIEREVVIMSHGERRAFFSLQSDYIIMQFQNSEGLSPAFSETLKVEQLRPGFRARIREAQKSGFQVEYRGPVLSDGDQPNAIADAHAQRGALMSMPHPSPSARHYPPMVRVSPKNLCPVCRKPTWCTISADGARAVCMRIRSERPTRNHGWLHILRDTQPASVQQRVEVKADPPKQNPELAPLEQRARVYALLISLLTLYPEHKNALLARGLTEEEISCLGYRSTPAAAAAERVATELQPLGLEGVPGFFRQDSSWRLRAVGPGILIPVRNPSLHIQAFQVRRDTDASPRYIWLSSAERPGGASSGSPVHYARTAHLTERGEAFLTEGALKADIIAARSRSTVVAIAGVSSFSEGFGLELKKALPQLRSVVLAYDQDWREKKQVKQALFRMIRELGRAGLEVNVRNWPREHKGYDDYLVRGIV